MATKPNKNIKVSQKTIDDIKKMGMTKALKEIKNLANQGQGTGAAGRTMRQEGMKLATSSEFAEGVRRLYGDRRSSAARTVVSPTTMRGPSAAKKAAASKPAAAKASTKYSPTPYKPPAKKSGGVSNTAKVVAGTAAAIGILAATRGRGTGAIAKVAPGFSRSGLGKVLMGTGKPFVPKGLGPKVTTKASTAVMKAKDAAAVARGKAAAKAGKPVSQSQYDAMVAAAKAKGVSTTAKKATTTAAKKTTAKKAAAAPTQSRWDANAPKPKAVKPPKTK